MHNCLPMVPMGRRNSLPAIIRGASIPLLGERAHGRRLDPVSESEEFWDQDSDSAGSKSPLSLEPPEARPKGFMSHACSDSPLDPPILRRGRPRSRSTTSSLPVVDRRGSKKALEWLGMRSIFSPRDVMRRSGSFTAKSNETSGSQ